MEAHGGSFGNRWLICFPLLLLAGCHRAAPPNSPHATVKLIAERRSIQPGRQFRVGLRFQIEKHWHIYWVNPGDSGEPPRVDWELPEGFQAGPIIWPAPRRLESSSLVDYGYEDEVLLMAPLEAPGGAAAGNSVEIRATVKWLVCSDICVPERQQVALPLTLEEGPPEIDPRWRQLFEQARAQIPQPLPPDWSVTAFSRDGHFILSVKSGTPAASAEFFPLVPLEIENAAPQPMSAGSGVIRLTLQKSDLLSKPLAFLEGVLILGDSKAFAIKAPVASQGDSGKKPGERRRRQ